MAKYKVLKKGKKIKLKSKDGAILYVDKKHFDFDPQENEILKVEEVWNTYDIQRISKLESFLLKLRAGSKHVISQFRNLSLKEQEQVVWFVFMIFVFTFLIMIIGGLSSNNRESVETDTVSTYSYSTNNSRTKLSGSSVMSGKSISFSSTESDQSLSSSAPNSKSSSNSSSTSSSSNKEKWTPTSQADVNKYLNISNTDIILRGRVLKEISYDLPNSDRVYEIEAEVMGIYEPDIYREYNIIGDRLLIRTALDLTPYINQVMVYGGNTIPIATYGVIGEGSIVIKTMRKTAQAQSAEQASIEASKAQALSSSRVTVTPTAPATSVAATPSSQMTSTPTVPESQTGLRPFRNCTEARAAGRVNIPASDPQYGRWLDRDGDGYGCDD